MAEDLFSSTEELKNQPLAYRMSPRNLDEYVGQEHIVGRGRLLRRVIQADRLSSLIFAGPPGTGKTSLARVIARSTKSAFTTLNAVLTGVKELRVVLQEAQQRRDLYDKRSILFVDEVHRWNKAQQDALLPWVENGTVILIGATTENPFFEVNPALVSRSRIFQLTPLGPEDMKRIALQALRDPARGYGLYRVEFEEGALEHLIKVADGDARSLLNALELAVETTPENFPPAEGEPISISLDAAEQSIQRKAVLYDKEGDYHFDIISAYIKSLRGSDPDAALYWLARMVHAGEDPHFIFRRLLISASEDIGMADPRALGVVEAAASAFDRVGMPEGRYHLAQATLYLATAAKSNSALGFFDALAQVEQEHTAEVPRHLKDANRDAKGFGHGEGYLYPHAYRNHWVNQQYLPESLRGKIFYRPSKQGYEKDIAEDVQRRREAQLAAGMEDEAPEVLSYSPPDKDGERWLARTLDERGKKLARIRDALFSMIRIPRHARVCVVGADEGSLLWEALRRVPEGGVSALVERQERLEYLTHYADQLPEEEQPEFFSGTPLAYLKASPREEASFELLLARDYHGREPDKSEMLATLYRLLREGGQLAMAQAIPRYSRRLSQLIDQEQLRIGDEDFLRALKSAEEELYQARSHPLLSWDEESLKADAEKAGFQVQECRMMALQERRRIQASDIRRWLDPDRKNGIGAFLQSHLSPAEVNTLSDELSRQLDGKIVPWSSRVCLLTAKK